MGGGDFGVLLLPAEAAAMRFDILRRLIVRERANPGQSLRGIEVPEIVELAAFRISLVEGAGKNKPEQADSFRDPLSILGRHDVLGCLGVS